MRVAKGVVLSVIFAVIAFFVFQTLTASDELVSPIPQSDGVKVIRVTPSK